MIRQIQNLSWDVPSPSHYILNLPDRSDAIELFYLGDDWCLFLERHGHVSTRCFKRFADAIEIVAQAFRNEGVI